MPHRGNEMVINHLWKKRPCFLDPSDIRNIKPTTRCGRKRNTLAVNKATGPAKAFLKELSSKNGKKLGKESGTRPRQNSRGLRSRSSRSYS